MKCPSCGAEIREGSLYCESCGEDVHIVPDFDAEVEEASRQMIEKITVEIREELPADGEGKEPGMQGEDDAPDRGPGASPRDGRKSGGLPRGGGKGRWLFWLLAGSAAAVVLILIAVLRLRGSQEPQLTRLELARSAAAAGEYETAASIYRELLEDNPGDLDRMIDLLSAYEELGDEEAQEEMLWRIARAPEITQAQYFTVYGRLVELSLARGEYQEIADFLWASGNAELWAEYEEYLGAKVEFDPPGGYYQGVVKLELLSEADAEIYYRIDGGGSETIALFYEEPVVLEEGDYLISAYAVDARGVIGQTAVEEYHVTAAPVPTPQVKPKSGSYQAPLYIEAEQDALEEGTAIYYTTDGSEPGEGSLRYTGRIPMPLGSSVFRFVCVDADGHRSETADREYELSLNAPYSLMDAEAMIALHFGAGAVMTVEFRYAYHEDGVGDFYLFRVDHTIPEQAEPVRHEFAFSADDGRLWEGGYDGEEWYFTELVRNADGSVPEQEPAEEGTPDQEG